MKLSVTVCKQPRPIGPLLSAYAKMTPLNIVHHIQNKKIYFIVSGEISVYLVKIKVVSITSELISYHFTSD